MQAEDPSAGIAIRAQRESDLPAIAAIRNSPKARWGTLATPFESAERWRKRREAMQPGHVELVACAAGEPVGMAGMFRNKEARRAHVAVIGITIRDDWQGKGIGTKLFAALTDLADNWLGLHRLELSVYTDNPAAIALYQKFGFETEATETAEAFRDGGFANSYVMGRLRPALSRADATPIAIAPRGLRAECHLRAAEPSDTDAISDIMAQARVRHFTLAIPFTTSDAHMAWAAPEDPGTKSIVAVVEGKVIGIASLTAGRYRRAHAGEITLLAVHDDWQGRGVGRVLLTALLNIADQWLNLQRLQLGMTVDNAPAIQLFETAGFVAEGTKRADVFRGGFYVDTLLMARLPNR
jgi:putative acetyltransferase